MPHPVRPGQAPQRIGVHILFLRMANTARKLTVLVLGYALVACSTTSAPHSDYFIVAFLPGTPTPSQEGVEALGNAVNQAGRSRPRLIAIDGVEPEGGASAAQEQARAQAIIDAFVRSGIDLRTIHSDLRPADEKAYDARRDTFLIQLEYGEPPR